MPQLLNRPQPSVFADLELIYRALAEVFPVRGKHRKDLPLAVSDLSSLLTVERGRSKAYWSNPRFTAAYLHYFLPWNLVRLAWLLPGLDLPLRPGDRLLDLGSGPLTLPLGLWLARPDLRGKELEFFCCDPAARPMELGKEIYLRLEGPAAPWRFHLLPLPLEKAMSRAQAAPGHGFALVSALNVLNEAAPSRRESLEERLDGIMERMERLTAPGGRILLMEPGTRLGGRIIAQARPPALERGLRILAPCPHERDCPCLDQEKEHKAARPEGRYTGWCHFSHPSGLGRETELTRLSREAGLSKDERYGQSALHLSCLLLGKDGAARPENRNRLDLRVISGRLSLPGRAAGRYACSALGLALLEGGGNLASGELVAIPMPQIEGTDPKSGARIIKMSPEKPETTQAPGALAAKEGHAPRPRNRGKDASGKRPPRTPAGRTGKKDPQSASSAGASSRERKRR